MTFRELLGGLSGQRVLVNVDGPEAGYTVGEFVTLGDDFISIVFASEAVHYPVSRVLEVRTARDERCYVLAEGGSGVEVRLDEQGGSNPLLLIVLSRLR